MSKSTLYKLLDGYSTDGGENGSASGGKHFVSRAFSGRMDKQKKGIAFAVYRFAKSFEERVMFTGSRSYGFMALTFGLLTVILHFAGDFFIESMEASITSIIIGAVSSLVSVPLLFSHESLSHILQEMPLTRWLLFDFLCIKRATHKDDGKDGIPTYVLVFLGIVLATVGFFVPVKYLVIGGFAFAFAHLAFQSPEFSTVSLVLVMPYTSLLPMGDYVLSALLLLSVISLFRKAIRGKRVMLFEQYDLLVALLMLIVAISFAVMNRAVDLSLLLALVPFLGYTLGSNIISNRRLADCVMNAFVVSALPATALSLVRAVRSAFSGEFLELIKNGESSVFSSPMAYAAYLTVAAVFCIFFIHENEGAKRVAYCIALTVNAVGIILAGCPFIPFVILLCIPAYRLLLKRKNGAIPVLAIGVLVYLLYLLPEALLDFVLKGNGISAHEQKLIVTEGLDVILDNLLLGVGAGKESAAAELLSRGFNHDSFISAPLQLACGSGVVALILLILIITVRVRHRAVYFPFVNSVHQLGYSTVTSVAFFAFITVGAVCDIFSSPLLSIVLWFIIGMGSAVLRISKREYDDKKVYLMGQSSHDASETEIEVREF